MLRTIYRIGAGAMWKMRMINTGIRVWLRIFDVGDIFPSRRMHQPGQVFGFHLRSDNRQLPSDRHLLGDFFTMIQEEFDLVWTLCWMEGFALPPSGMVIRNTDVEFRGGFIFIHMWHRLCYSGLDSTVWKILGLDMTDKHWMWIYVCRWTQ